MPQHTDDQSIYHFQISSQVRSKKRDNMWFLGNWLWFNGIRETLWICIWDVMMSSISVVKRVQQFVWQHGSEKLGLLTHQQHQTHFLWQRRTFQRLTRAFACLKDVQTDVKMLIRHLKQVKSDSSYHFMRVYYQRLVCKYSANSFSCLSSADPAFSSLITINSVHVYSCEVKCRSDSSWEQSCSTEPAPPCSPSRFPVGYLGDTRTSVNADLLACHPRHNLRGQRRNGDRKQE